MLHIQAALLAAPHGRSNWGVSPFLSANRQAGLVGYVYYQLSSDSGGGDKVGGFKSRVASIGPRIGYLFDNQVYLNWDKRAEASEARLPSASGGNAPRRRKPRSCKFSSQAADDRSSPKSRWAEVDATARWGLREPDRPAPLEAGEGEGEGESILMMAMIRNAAVTALLLALVCNAQSLSAQPGSQRSPYSSAVSEAAVLGLPESNGPVVVHAAFHVLNISAINDESETIAFSGVLTLTWKDPRQAFDPSKEGVSEKLYQGAFQVNEFAPSWYPQVTLVNEAGVYQSRAVLLRVRPDGTSTLTDTIGATSQVNLQLQRYPFDRQRLELVYQVLGFDADAVVLDTDPESASVDLTMTRVPQWDLGEVGASIRTTAAPYVGKKGVASAFVVAIDVKRKPLFMLRLVILPLIMIVMLSWVVFWMDRSSVGDRMSVSFVGILTAVAYQIVVGGTMPQIAYLTFMNGFLVASMALMCATVVINLIVARSEQSGSKRRGDLIDRRCRWIFPGVYAGLLLFIFGIAFLYL